MNKLFIGIIVLIIIAAGGYVILNFRASKVQEVTVADYKNISYLVEGRLVQLKNGIAETEAAPGSASKITTRYFGNELETDLDGDGLKDITFILTQDSGGSGTFFYAVAARNTGAGYVGSNGYLLGDRIAPQSTDLSSDPKQKHVVVFNYADRGAGEPMTMPPSVGKSVYLKLNPETMQWEVEDK